MNLPVGIYQVDSVGAADAIRAGWHVHRIRSAQHLLDAAKVLPARVDQHLHMSTGNVALHSVPIMAAWPHERQPLAWPQIGSDCHRGPTQPAMSYVPSARQAGCQQ